MYLSLGSGNSYGGLLLLWSSKQAEHHWRDLCLLHRSGGCLLLLLLLLSLWIEGDSPSSSAQGQPSDCQGALLVVRAVLDLGFRRDGRGRGKKRRGLGSLGGDSCRL